MSSIFGRQFVVEDEEETSSDEEDSIVLYSDTTAAQSLNATNEGFAGDFGRDDSVDAVGATGDAPQQRKGPPLDRPPTLQRWREINDLPIAGLRYRSGSTRQALPTFTSTMKLMMEPDDTIDVGETTDDTIVPPAMTPLIDQICHSRAYKAMERVSDYLMSRGHFFTTFTLVLAVLCSLFGAAIDWLIQLLSYEHIWLSTELVDGFWSGYVIWVCYTMLLTMGAMLAVLWAPAAGGSGIPQMQVVLSGARIRRLLSIKTFLAKMVSVTFANGSGLVVGKEGPFVHACAILANQLTRLPPFRHIRANPTLLNKFLAVGCGAGLAANFGAPLGGVMFSLEVTANYYAVNDYFYAFACSGLCAILFWALTGRVAFILTELPVPAYGMVELPLFVVLSAIIGLLAAVTSNATFYVFAVRDALLSSATRLAESVPSRHPRTRGVAMWMAGLASNGLAWGLGVALVVALITYPGQYEPVGLGGHDALDELFSDGALPSTWNDGAVGSVYFTLAYFFLTRWIGMIISLTVPAAVGLFIPNLMIGAALGRMMGEALLDVLADGVHSVAWAEPPDTIVPGGYAVVGACAMVAGVSHTLSPAVAMLEITGQLAMLGPCVLAVLVSVGVSRFFTPSYYEILARERRLPLITPLAHELLPVHTSELMVPRERMGVMVLGASNAEVADMLNATPEQRIYPVVQRAADGSEGVFVGQTTRRSMQLYLLESALPQGAPGKPQKPSSSSLTFQGFESLRRSVRGWKVGKVWDYADTTILRRPKVVESTQPELLVEWPKGLVSPTTELLVLHMMFVELQLTEAIVLGHDGGVVGMVTRDQIAALRSRTHFKEKCEIILDRVDDVLTQTVRKYRRVGMERIRERSHARPKRRKEDKGDVESSTETDYTTDTTTDTTTTNTRNASTTTSSCPSSDES